MRLWHVALVGAALLAIVAAFFAAGGSLDQGLPPPLPGESGNAPKDES